MSDLLDRLRRETGWHDVRERRREFQWGGQTYYDRVVEFVASDPAWPALYIVLGDSSDDVAQFGIGEWHTHPDELDDAIRLARELISGRKGVLEERNRSGAYAGSGLVEPGGVLHGLSQDAASFRRVFFNRPPADEPIDFSRYQKLKHGWIEKSHLARMKETYAKAGMKWDLE